MESRHFGALPLLTHLLTNEITHLVPVFIYLCYCSYLAIELGERRNFIRKMLKEEFESALLAELAKPILGETEISVDEVSEILVDRG